MLLTTLRIADESDAEAISSFERRLRAENLATIFRFKTLRSIPEEAALLRAFGTSPNSAVFVAVLDVTVIGVLRLKGESHRQTRHVARLAMAVHAEYRSQGVGSALLEAAIDLASESALRRIELEVMENNPRAQAFYVKRGFAIEGKRRDAVLVDGRYVDLVQMSLDVPPARPCS